MPDVRASERASTSSVPFLVFCLYTFILIGRPQDYIPALQPMRPALVFTIITLAITFLAGSSDSPSPFSQRATKVYLVFYLVMVAGIPFSLHRRLSFEFAVLGYVVNVIFFILFVHYVNTFAKFKKVVLVLMLAALMFSVLGLRHGTFIKGRYGTIGLGFDPNDIAFVVLSLLSFSICVLLGPFRRFAKVLAFASVISGVVLALYTGSRGGLLGLVIFLLLFLALGISGVPKKGKISIIAVLALAAAMNVDKINLDRYSTLGELDKDYNTTEFGRVGIWRQGLEMFSEDPLTGVGVTRFGQAIGTRRMEGDLIPEWQAPHNSYIQVLAELGIFGAGAFFWLVFGCLSTLSRLRRNAVRTKSADLNVYPTVLLIGYIAQLVGAFFLSQAYSMFFTLSFAVAAALNVLSANSVTAASQTAAEVANTAPVIHARQHRATRFRRPSNRYN